MKVKMLVPYKGYTILKVTNGSDTEYYAGRKFSTAVSDMGLHEWSLKEIKEAIRGDIAAEEWIAQANYVLNRR